MKLGRPEDDEESPLTDDLYQSCDNSFPSRAVSPHWSYNNFSPFVDETTLGTRLTAEMPSRRVYIINEYKTDKNGCKYKHFRRSLKWLALNIIMSEHSDDEQHNDDNERKKKKKTRKVIKSI